MTEAQKVRYAERQKYGMSDVQKKREFFEMKQIII